MRVGVVGGGVVGLATAWYLAERGADPFVVDAGSVGGGCSRGSLGWISPTLSVPLAGPGLGWRSLAGMLRRDGPLYIRAAALPSLLPWLAGFRRHCTESAWTRGIARLAALNEGTMGLYDGLAAAGVDFEFARRGILIAFRDRGKAEQTRTELRAVSELSSTRWREVDGAGLQELEPLLKPGFSEGFLLESDGHLRPESLTSGLAAALRGRGVELVEGCRVDGYREDGRRVRALTSAEGDLDADAVVLAAGVGTAELARAAGQGLPLTAGKGYTVTVEAPTRQLRRPLILGDEKVGMTPFSGAVRFGGTMELSGVNDRLDPRRVAPLRDAVERGVEIAEAQSRGVEWVGMRPMLPDTLPLVGRIASRRNVFVNVGHQMLGLTLAPSCGKALAEMVTG